MRVPGLAVTGIVGGLVVGSRALTGLDGSQLAPMEAAGKLLPSWLCALAPILAFAAIGLLTSVIFGRSPIGLPLPAFGGLGISLASTARPERPSTSSTSTRTGGTSPTATDRTK
ncbi:MAG: hypothetical protein ACRDN0_29220 [Trebonia sp.]